MIQLKTRLNDRKSTFLTAIISSLIITGIIIPINLAVGATPTQLVMLETTYEMVRYSDNYVLGIGSTLEFTADPKPGWNYDYMDIDFGCELGGVTGENVTDIFAITGGLISFCGAG